MGIDFVQQLESCDGFADIFELVKEATEKTIGKTRAGLMLGLAELGQSASSFLGAYHEVDSNLIVMNSTPLHFIKEKNPELFNPYCFYVLLHEYLHSLGFLDEQEVRELTLKISIRIFGQSHAASLLARDFSKFLPGLVYGSVTLIPKKEPTIFIVQGFDKGNLNYVN